MTAVDSLRWSREEPGSPSVVAEIAAIAAAGCVGEIAPMVVPLYLGPVMADFGVSEGTAGIAPSLEVAGIATGAVAFASIGRRIHPRVALWASLVFVVVGQICSIFVDSWTMFIAIRAAVGLGEGVLVASASIQAALTRKPHRAFSVLLVAIIAVFMGCSLAIPAVTALVGPRAAFAVLLGLAVLATPFLVCFPARLGSGPADAVGWLSARALRLLTAAVFTYVAFSALWTYCGQIGMAAGLGLGGVGLVVTVSGGLGAAGPLLAGVVGVRWGYGRPVLTGLAMVAAAGAVLATAWSVAIFAVATIAAFAAFMFFVTYLRGLMGALDSSGRLVGIGVGVVTFGGAAGPFVAGSLLDAGGGYPALGLLAVSSCGIAGILMAPVARSVDRADQVAAESRGNVETLETSVNRGPRGCPRQGRSRGGSPCGCG